jgi:hypothetical protein
MSIDINNDLNEASSKTKTYKTYKEYKEGYDELKTKSGESTEKSNDLISNQLSSFSETRKKHTTNSKTFLDELIKQLKDLKGTGVETNAIIKRTFLNSLKKIKPELKNLLIDEVKSAFNCSNTQQYQFNSTYYIPVRSVDLLNIFEYSPEDRIGKLSYEEKPITFITYPFSMNKELYNRTQNLNQPFSSIPGTDFIGKSNQPLFNITYVESFVDPLTSTIQNGNFFKVDLSQRQTPPLIDVFLNDYYESIDILDFKTFFTNLVDYVTGSISFGRGDGKLKLSSLQRNLFIIQRLLGLCSDNTKEINVGGVSKVSEIDNVDNSFYEFSSIDLRIIDQITSDIKLGVVEFKDCDMIKYPLNVEGALTALENLNFNEDTSDNNEINDASNIIYPALDDNFKLSIDEGFFEQFIKALINTVLSPKVILPIMITAGMSNQPIFREINNMEDFIKKFKKFYNEFVSKIAAIFVKIIFIELKREIQLLVLLLIKDIGSEKKRKINLMILTIVALIPSLIRIVRDFRECKSVLDELLQILNLGVRRRIGSLSAVGGEIPLPLLLSSRLLDGFSPTRSFLNTIDKLQEIGVPTGPMPDGSPNKFLASIKAMIDGNSQEIAENGKVAIGIGPLTITPAGVTIPKDAYGKFI